MENFFTSDAIVNIILFLIGYIISAVYSYWRSRKGRWVVIEKVSESFIFSKPSEMKDEYAIEILAGNKPVDTLVQTQFLIKNTGADITDPVNLKIFFMKKNTNESIDVFGVKAQRDYFVFLLDELNFQKPFLNSSHAYKDAIKILVCSEHPLTLQVKGSGIGWKAKYVDKLKQKETYKEFWIGFLISVLPGSGLLKSSLKQAEEKDIVDEDDVWLGLV